MPRGSYLGPPSLAGYVGWRGRSVGLEREERVHIGGEREERAAGGARWGFLGLGVLAKGVRVSMKCYVNESGYFNRRCHPKRLFSINQFKEVAICFDYLLKSLFS